MPRTPAAFASGDRLGRYEILGCLGAGGMGEVFRARDPTLGREVALKTLPDELAGRPERLERLAREARALAALNHPNIVTLYSVEEADGRSFLTMELVEGQTLDEAIPKRGLALETFFALAIPLSDALAAAHERGVVHRDLKPSNVMVTSEERLKVLDFGLAQRAPIWGSEIAEEASTEEFTEPGRVVGTLAYMSPEQLEGKPADARSDIFALGVLLYQMLTGDHPFRGGTPVETTSSILRDEAQAVTLKRPDVPRQLWRIVRMCLEKSATARYQSARDITNELAALRREMSADRIVASSGGAAPEAMREWAPPPPRRFSWGAPLWTVGLLAVAVWLMGPSVLDRIAREPMPDTPIVAVLPLTNATGDPGNDHLGLGFSESLISRLAGIPSVTVVSRGAIAEYALAPAGRERIARDQGVTFLVDGSIQRINGRLQVTINLVDAQRAIVRRSWEQEGSLEGLFDLQRRLAVDVGRGLMLTLSEADQRRLESPLSESVLAFNDYSRARLLLQRPDRPGHLDRGIELLEQAVGRDSTFALAHAALGEAYWTGYRLRREPEWAERAIAAAERAARLDPDDPEVSRALARIYEGTGRREEAFALLSGVLERQPFSDDGWRFLATLLEREGRDEEALAAAERALSIRPVFWRNHAQLGFLYFQAGRFAEAAEAFRGASDLQEDNSWVLEGLGAALQAQGDLQGAMAAFRRATELGPGRNVAHANLGLIHYWEGDFALAAAEYERAIRIAPNVARYHYFVGRAYHRLGRDDEARSAFERAVEICAAELELNPQDSAAHSLYAASEARLGRVEEALSRAARAVQIAPGSSEAHFRAAEVLMIAGRQEEALAALEVALDHGLGVEEVRRDPDWDPLRGQPGFQVLVKTGAP
jgi:eukaryotic-like serine/threonine-protein kinase